MDERDTTRQMEQTADEARDQSWQGAGGTAHEGQHGQQAGGRARDVRDRVAENARALAEEARHRMTQGTEQLRHRGESLIGSQKNKAADEVSHLSEAIRGTAERLRGDQNEMIAGYADTLASHLDRTADYLRDRELMDLLHDAQAFARRRPELVLGGMFLAGLAVARIVKAGGDLSMGMGRFRNRQEDQGFSSSDEYGSYSGYREDYSETGGYRGAGMPREDVSTGITNPAFDTGGGTSALAGGLEHVEQPGMSQSLESSTATDADITASSDIEDRGTSSGGAPSIQP